MPNPHYASDEALNFLSRYAEEVAMLAKGLSNLQVSLGTVYGRGDLTADAIQNLQRLDGFTQTADVLAKVATELAQRPTLDSDTVASLIACVNLADVAARLQGDFTRDADGEAGGVEMF